MDRLALLRQYLADDPDDAFTRFAYAQELAKAGDPDGARAAYEGLRAAQPDYVGTYYALGALLERTGRRAEAAEVYRAGVAVATRLRDLHARAELQSALLAAEGPADDDA